MGNNVKYLSYSGLSHFKDRVFEVINPLMSENKANILSIQNFLENPVFEEVNTNTLNVISEINLNGTRLFNFDFLPLSGGTMTGTITSQSIIPAKTHTTSDTAYSLGSSSKQFNTTYTRYVDTVSGYNLRLRSGGVEHLNMIDGSVNSTANIMPTATNTYNLGSTNYKWNNIYANSFIENGEYLSSKYADKAYADYCSSYLHSANRAQFCKPAGVTLEYSTDSGSTWVDYGATDEQKIGFFSGISQGFYLGKKLSTKALASDMLRLTMDATAMGFYTSCKSLLINISTNGSSNFRVKVERSMKGSVDTFTTLIESQTLTGWSGWNRIPIGYAFGGSTTQTYNVAKLRLTFMSDGAGSSYTSGAHPQVIDMEVLGSTYWGFPHTMAKTGHIYSWDTSGNAIFSKNITAPEFIGNLTGNVTGNVYCKTLYENGTSLANKYAQISNSFITNRTSTDNLTAEQITSYADLSTSSAGQSAFKLLKTGSYKVDRSGSTELLINLGTNIGSTSALEFLTNYTHTSRLKVRKIIDSNRVSGAFKELAWYSDIPTKVSQLTNDAGYTTASGHTHTSLNCAGAQSTATTRNLTNFPASKTLFTGYWDSSGSYATQYGTTLDISYSTWYQRLAFNTAGRIEYFKGINSDNSDKTSATLSKIGDLAYTSDIPTKVSQLTNDAGYTASGHTHSKLSSTSISFTPAETALTPDNVYTLIGGTTIKRGTWSYSGNGYISNDTTGCGVIDLAGTTVIQADNGTTAYTQLYLTPSTGNTTNCKTNEIFMYNNNGSAYSPSWTRILTNRNYSDYCAPTSHTHNYLPLTGGTLTGALTINGSDADTANLHFGRTSYNYITGPSGSTIHMCPGGISKSSTTGYIFSSTAFYPGTTNAYSIGTTSLQWNNICGKTLYENGTSLDNKYLKLTGGTISSSAFCPLVIERSGSTNMASLRFKNSNGILGSIGMNTVYGSLLLHNADGTENKTILDSSNYNTYAAAKTHTHSYVPLSERVNATAVSHTNYSTNGTYVPTMNFLSYWNGAYNSSNSSNLTYCKHGAFGTIVTKNTGDYAAASHSHSAANITSGTLSVSRGGTGLSTITAGHVIIGNGTGTPTTTKIAELSDDEIDAIFTDLGVTF